MPEGRINPFDSLESTHEYIRLLEESLAEARRSVEEDTAVAGAEAAERRLHALQLVLFKLDALEKHMQASRRIVNDLRMLRRMLLSERDSTAPVAQPIE